MASKISGTSPGEGGWAGQVAPGRKGVGKPVCLRKRRRLMWWGDGGMGRRGGWRLDQPVPEGPSVPWGSSPASTHTERPDRQAESSSCLCPVVRSFCGGSGLAGTRGVCCLPQRLPPNPSNSCWIFTAREACHDVRTLIFPRVTLTQGISDGLTGVSTCLFHGGCISPSSAQSSGLLRNPFRVLVRDAEVGPAQEETGCKNWLWFFITESSFLTRLSGPCPPYSPNSALNRFLESSYFKSIPKVQRFVTMEAIQKKVPEACIRRQGIDCFCYLGETETLQGMKCTC